MILCGVFSASNTIHVCIQLPTSQKALKIQKYGQMIVLGIYLLLFLFGFILGQDESNSDLHKDTIFSINSEYDELFWLQLTFLGLFLVTTISCLYA